MAGADLGVVQRGVELADVQGLLRSGYGDLTEACFLLLRVVEPNAARRWLGAAPVTNAAARRAGTVLQVAFAAGGLRAVGLSEAVLEGFSAEFLSGMAGDPSRSRRLGDVGDNAPSYWRWGVAPAPDILLALYARTDLAAWRAQVTAGDFAQAFAVLEELETSDMGGSEPFGFADGVSQPAIDWKERRHPGTDADLEYGNLLAAGEFVLGYRNEYGLYTDRPLVDHCPTLPEAADHPGCGDFGRNGTYLVLRELHQDVRQFWRTAAALAGSSGDAVGLAEALVGRHRSGEPLLPSGRALRGLTKPEDIRRNGFDYDEDREGARCPLGAHVRRANPRTADMPGGRQSAIAQLARTLAVFHPDLREDLIASSRFHRLLRRGREFGRLLPSEDAARPDAPDPRAGLFFICLGANIARQFEFVQGAWLMSGKFAGLGDEADPLLGERSAGDEFGLTLPNGMRRRLEGLRPFIRVKAGAYFFLPGLRALRYLASLST